MTEKEKKEALDFLLANSYDKQMNYELVEMVPGRVVMTTFADRTKFENSYKAVHGGVLYGLSDSYMGMACYSVGKVVSTMGLSIHYIRPTKLDSTVRGEAKILHNGSKTLVAICDFYNEEGKPLAHCEGTYFVLGKAPWGGEESGRN